MRIAVEPFSIWNHRLKGAQRACASLLISPLLESWKTKCPLAQILLDLPIGIVYVGANMRLVLAKYYTSQIDLEKA